MATLTKNGRSIEVPDDQADYYVGQGWAVPGAEAPKPKRRRRKPKPAAED